MNILEMGAQMLSEKLGLQLDTATIQSALSSLLGDGQGGIDIAGLASKMASSGELGDIVSSWLGDGGNASISADSIMSLLGSGEVANFANTLGTDTQTAASGLADVLPEMVDKASSGGSLLESVGGLGGILGAANSLFK